MYIGKQIEDHESKFEDERKHVDIKKDFNRKVDLEIKQRDESCCIIF